MKHEYFLKDIKFDEYDRLKIDKELSYFKTTLDRYSINLEEDLNEEVFKNILVKDLTEIASLKDKLLKLTSAYPRLKYAFEFNTLNSILEKTVRCIEFCNFSVERVDLELKKTFTKERTINDHIPFSEFKKMYSMVLNDFTQSDFDRVDFDNLCNQSIVKWMMSKTNFDFNEKDEVQIKRLKHVNEDIYSWITQRLFSKHIQSKFGVYVPEGKTKHKYIIKSTDELGKKVKLSHDEVMIFEMSLSDFNEDGIQLGSKFKFPEGIGLDFIASSKYVIMNQTISIDVYPDKIKVYAPVFVRMIKATPSFKLKSSI